MLHLTKYIGNLQIRIFYYNISNAFLEENQEFMKLLDEQILAVCKEDGSAKDFSVLNFLVYGNNKSGLFKMFLGERVVHISEYNKIAFVRNETNGQIKVDSEILRNDCTVYINSSVYSNPKLRLKLDEGIPTSKDTQIAGIVSHELMHLHHHKISDYSKTYETGERLSDAIANMSGNDAKAALQVTREQLYLLLGKIISEGIARFKEASKTGYSRGIKVTYDKDSFTEFYELATLHIKDLLDSLKGISIEYDIYLKNNKGSAKKVSENLQVIRKLNENKKPYDIGFHIIYSIIYDDNNQNLDELSKMSYIQILRLYDKAMIRQGCQPVISYNSSKGMFDYAGWLEKLNNTYKEVEKK